MSHVYKLLIGLFFWALIAGLFLLVFGGLAYYPKIAIGVLVVGLSYSLGSSIYDAETKKD